MGDMWESQFLGEAFPDFGSQPLGTKPRRRIGITHKPGAQILKLHFFAVRPPHPAPLPQNLPGIHAAMEEFAGQVSGEREQQFSSFVLAFENYAKSTNDIHNAQRQSAQARENWSSSSHLARCVTLHFPRKALCCSSTSPNAFGFCS